MKQRRDYYEILSVSRDVDEPTLKSAYRKLALTYHPDRNPNNPDASEKFREASEAYAVLRIPRSGRATTSSGTPAWERGPGRAEALGLRPFGLRRLFGSLQRHLRIRRRAGGPAGGSDLVYRMEITFENAAHGVEAPIAISRLESCDDCDGVGAAEGTQPRTCPACRGTGRQRLSQGFLPSRGPAGLAAGTGASSTSPARVAAEKDADGARKN